MARIYPFQPYRYSASAGPLENLVTQPYDKISPEMQSRYLSLSPYNLVRIILGPRSAADSQADNVYTRAANYLSDWIERGILEREPQPALFPYFQEFQVPDTGERLVRKGFIGLGAVEDYSKGVVHRHEQTLSGPKKDRLELLRHTRAHFGQIFMLYPDPEGEIDRILDEAAAGPPAARVCDEYQAEHRLWKISEPSLIARVRQLMSDKKLLIADGHHRYETALAFRNENPGLPGADRVMMTFVNMYSEGLKILATHRLVRNLAAFDPAGFLEKARQSFRVSEAGSLEDLRKAWAEEHAGQARIGVLMAGSERIQVLEKPREHRLVLDVLHKDVLEGLLGISEEAVREERYLSYVRGADAAVDRVRRGAAQIAFLVEPVAIEEVGRIAFSGGVMPQKSTDFYPKLLSGLTIYKL